MEDLFYLIHDTFPFLCQVSRSEAKHKCTVADDEENYLDLDHRNIWIFVKFLN